MCTRQGLLVSLLVLALSVAPLPAWGAPPEPTATSAEDPSIPPDELALLLQPLRKDALVVEVEAWIALLEQKAREISAAEIAVKRKNAEIAAAKELADAASDASEALASAAQARRRGARDLSAEEKAREAKEELAAAAEEGKAAERRANTDDETRRATEQALAETRAAGEAAPSAAQTERAGSQAAQLAEHAGERGDTGTLAKAAERADAAAEKKDLAKESLLDRLARLRAERTALIDRASTAIDALEEKGGEVDEYRLFVKAVSGLKVDVSDASSTWAAMRGWLVADEGGKRWLRNAAKFLALLLVTFLLSLLAAALTRRALRVTRRVSDLMRDFLVKLAKRAVLLGGALLAISSLEVDIGPLLAMIGAAGFVIAFALQDTLGNFASGMMILFYRPFDVGDLIEVSGVFGTVSSMSLVSTRIRTLDNQVIHVPNNQIWGGVITNVTGTDKRRVDMVFGIGYGDDFEKAKPVIEGVLGEDERVLSEPAATVRVHELGDSSVNIICRPWVKTADYWELYWSVTERVKQRFDEEGISIPFPQRDVHVYHAAAPEGAELPQGDRHPRQDV